MGNGKRKWTVMVYLAGDNNLDSAGLVDLKEMKKAGSSDEVAVVAQFDRSGKKNATKRYLLTRGGTVENDLVEELGETNTGDPDVLRNFILWAMKEYPAGNYLLVIWNHGNGWDDENVYRVAGRRVVRKGVPISGVNSGAAIPFGAVRSFLGSRFKQTLFSTSVLSALTTRGIAYDDNARDFLDNVELKKVLSHLEGKIAVLGMDACMMNMIEVLYQIKDTALFCVGSQETEPGDGWPYDRILGGLAAAPGMRPAELAGRVVSDYLKSYSASDNVTQSACDLAQADEAAKAVDRLAGELIKGLPKTPVRLAVMKARARVQSYYVEDYVDLVDLCELIGPGCGVPAIKDACAGVVKAVTREGIVVKSGSKGKGVKHSHGLSIYFPTKTVSPLYAKLDFAKKTKWGRFLKEYMGKVRGR